MKVNKTEQKKAEKIEKSQESRIGSEKGSPTNKEKIDTKKPNLKTDAKPHSEVATNIEHKKGNETSPSKDHRIDTKIEHKKGNETSPSKDHRITTKINHNERSHSKDQKILEKRKKDREKEIAKEHRIEEMLNAMIEAKMKKKIKPKSKPKIKANANNIKVIIRVRKLLRNEVGKENIVYLDQTVIFYLI